jgi:hypothetical protein
VDFFTGGVSLKVKLITLVQVPLLLAGAWVIVDTMGLAERYLHIGLTDESTLARINIWNVFELLDGQDLW